MSPEEASRLQTTRDEREMQRTRKLGLPSLAGAREEDKPKAGEEEATRDTIKEKGHNKREKGRVRTDNGPREKLHLSEGERREGRERRRDGRFEKRKRSRDGWKRRYLKACRQDPISSDIHSTIVR